MHLEKSESRHRRAIRGMLVFTGFGYAAQALSLVAIPVYLHYLGIERYGLFVLVITFAGYLNFAEGGIGWSSMILIGEAHGKGDREVLRSTVRNSIAFAAFSGCAALLFLGLVAGAALAGYRLPMFAKTPEADHLIIVAGVYVTVNMQVGAFYNFLQGIQETAWTAAYQGMGRLLSITMMMLTAMATRSVLCVMLAQLAVALLVGAICIAHALRRYPWILGGGGWVDRIQLRRQMRTAAKVFTLQAGRTLVGTSPIIAISTFIGAYAIPLYTLPTTLFQLLLLPLNMWSTSLQSAYSEAWASGNHAWVSSTFRNVILTGALLCFCAISIFVPIGGAFIYVWTSGKLDISGWIIAAVALIGFGNWLQIACQYLLVAINKQREIGVAELVAGLMSLGLCSLSVRSFGVAGVGLGVAASILLVSFPWTYRGLKNCLVEFAPLPVYELLCLAFMAVVIGGGGVLLSSVYAGRIGERGVVFLLLTALTCVVSILLWSYFFRLKVVTQLVTLLRSRT